MFFDFVVGFKAEVYKESNMPALKTFHDNKNIYSVDMMVAYVNAFEHPIVKLPIEQLVPQLKEKVWGEWSPMDVIEKMDAKKYKEDAERIRTTNIAYPIIITSNRKIVDGYHRISRLYLDHGKTVNAYVFDAALMNKFILNKEMDFVKVHQHTPVSEILGLWTKRFC